MVLLVLVLAVTGHRGRHRFGNRRSRWTRRIQTWQARSHLRQGAISRLGVTFTHVAMPSGRKLLRILDQHLQAKPYTDTAIWAVWIPTSVPATSVRAALGRDVSYPRLTLLRAGHTVPGVCESVPNLCHWACAGDSLKHRLVVGHSWCQYGVLVAEAFASTL